MSDSTEPHPLDDFEFGKATPIDDSRTRAYQPLLRICVIIAAIGFGLVFIFSLLSNAAPYDSPMQQTCNGISKFSGLITLLACCGILFAYRLPHIDFEQLRSGALTATGVFSNGYSVLAGINLIVILMIWASVFLASGFGGLGGYLSIALSCLLPCLGALGATIAIHHRGYLQAYGVGVLTVIMMVSSGAVNMFMMVGIGMGQNMGMGRAVPNFSVSAATSLTAPLLIGLMCAGYVLLVQKLTRAQK